jgi:hypothetical protein
MSPEVIEVRQERTMKRLLLGVLVLAAVLTVGGC